MPSFDHAAYLKTLAPNASPSDRIAAFCLICEKPIMPPAANHGFRFCPECWPTPDYGELFGP